MAKDMLDLEVSIAVVDDDPMVLETIGMFAKKVSSYVQLFSDSKECLSAISNDPVDILITDLDMPCLGGLGLMKKVKNVSPSTDIIVITGDADKKAAIEALRLGAFDFFEKPAKGETLMATLKRTVAYRKAIAERDRLAEQVSFLTKRESGRWGVEGFIGESAGIKKVLKDIQTVSRSKKTSVLIAGESGTGKELVAHAIHLNGERANGPFIPINSSAVPADLAESILFGHLKGSFTGAISDRAGAFTMANGGTIFLDEIGDMSPAVQAKLLRVLEDSVVVPVGASKGKEVDVKVVAATNAALEEKLESKSFRSDLYYRLAGFEICIPPLRERRSDIALLVSHFVVMLSEEMGFVPPLVSSESMKILSSHDYPGNVRELKNVIERALLESNGEEIEPQHLHFVRALGSSAESASASRVLSSVVAVDLPDKLLDVEDLCIRRVLEKTDGNLTAAACLLGISRATLYRRLAEMDIETP